MANYAGACHRAARCADPLGSIRSTGYKKTTHCPAIAALECVLGTTPISSVLCTMELVDYLRNKAVMYWKPAEQADDPVVKNEMPELASRRIAMELALDTNAHTERTMSSLRCGCLPPKAARLVKWLSVNRCSRRLPNSREFS